MEELNKQALSHYVPPNYTLQRIYTRLQKVQTWTIWVMNNNVNIGGKWFGIPVEYLSSKTIFSETLLALSQKPQAAAINRYLTKSFPILEDVHPQSWWWMYCLHFCWTIRVTTYFIPLPCSNLERTTGCKRFKQVLIEFSSICWTPSSPLLPIRSIPWFRAHWICLEMIYSYAFIIVWFLSYTCSLAFYY